MSTPDDLPEPDRLEGAPHPRAAAQLHGHASAEAAFLEAFNAGRLHHGWLIGGPRGIGKATLAWRMARFLLAQPAPGAGLFAAPEPETLDLPADHPVGARLRATGTDPGLMVIRRGWDEKTRRLRAVITVEETRRLQRFFAMSSSDGGWRVVIVDAADEMNLNAANALLKSLEEPPARAVLLLVAHQPSALLPTVRSRCRALPLAPLGAGDLAAALAQAGVAPGDDPAALAELAGGSVGAAIRLLEAGGLALYAELVALFGAAPGIDRAAAHRLADRAAARGAEDRFDLTVALTELFLTRAARAGVTGPPAVEAAPGEHAALARLSPNTAAARAWATAQAEIPARARQARAVNLDPSAIVLDMVLRVDTTARDIR